MAKSRKNVVMHGASGNVGDLLRFIQRGGNTYFGKIPTISKNVTEKQTEVREKFGKAVQYAKAAIVNPQLKDLYLSRGTALITPFNLAIVDYFTPPNINDIVTTGYHGAVGNTLELLVSDDTGVKEVRVTISAPDGTPIETGAAVQQADTPIWSYKATAVNNLLAGSKIKVTAIDFPGNLTTVEKVL